MFHLVTSGPCWIEVEAWSSPETDWLQGTLRFMAAEASELRPGGETVITRLADILVIQAIRSWIAQDAAPQSGWLGALQDPQIGRAITLIHRGPARPWTVASLAAGVLAEHLAATWLQEDDAPLGTWRDASATSPRPPSAGRSSASSGSRRGRTASRANQQISKAQARLAPSPELARAVQAHEHHVGR